MLSLIVSLFGLGSIAIVGNKHDTTDKIKMTPPPGRHGPSAELPTVTFEARNTFPQRKQMREREGRRGTNTLPCLRALIGRFNSRIGTKGAQGTG